jgi:hypothetical protein
LIWIVNEHDAGTSERPPQAPDAEVLQQQSMKLAILALVQIGALPAVHVRAPKRCASPLNHLF